MSLNDVISRLRNDGAGLPAGPVEVAYSSFSLLDYDIQMTLPHVGIRLYFDSACQRLAHVEAFALDRVRLVLNRQNLINAPDARLTLEMTAHHFGPTQPGGIHGSTYVLPYRGLSVAYHLSRGERDANDLANSLVATRLAVSSPSLPSPFAGSLSTPVDATGMTLHMPEPCALCDTRGDVIPCLHVLCADPTAIRVGSPSGPRIAIGDACQDVLAVLGAPDSQFVYTGPPLAVGTVDPAGESAVPLKASSASVERNYFYNYFRFGIDVLLDAATHRVLKIIFHTNLPGYHDFALYQKANFAIEVLPIGAARESPAPPPPPETGADDDGTETPAAAAVVGDLLGIEDLAPQVPRRASVVTTRPYDPIIVGPDTRWFNLQNLLGKTQATEKVIELDLRGYTGRKTRTLHGHENLIFEIIDEEHISAITLF